MKIDKFIDSWFTGRCLKHPVVVAVIFYLIGYAVGTSMKREDIIRMAREAGFTELEFYGNKLGTNPTKCLEAFAALVAAASAAAEREKSLQLWMLLDDIDTADDIAKTDHDTYRRLCRNTQQKRWAVLSESEVDAAIRARGQA
jgi:hypothetical protein